METIGKPHIGINICRFSYPPEPVIFTLLRWPGVLGQSTPRLHGSTVAPQPFGIACENLKSLWIIAGYH